MIMADVLKIFLLVLGMLIVIVSYWLAAEALFPRLVARAQERYSRRPVRLTLLGLRGVSSEVLEAGVMAGCTPRQTLLKVEIPAARPTIMVGVNQVIMQCLAMVVIASFIGAKGLGHDLLFRLQSLRIGQALEEGEAAHADGHDECRSVAGRCQHAGEEHRRRAEHPGEVRRHHRGGQAGVDPRPRGEGEEQKILSVDSGRQCGDEGKANNHQEWDDIDGQGKLRLDRKRQQENTAA